MRFHAKFPSLQVATGLIWIVLAVMKLRAHHFLDSSGFLGINLFFFTALIWLFVSIWAVVSYFQIYWELNSDGLLERRYGLRRKIAYPAIESVRSWTGKASSSFLAIDYGKVGSAFEPRTTLIANPSNREAFLQSLRSHAPDAEFSV